MKSNPWFLSVYRLLAALLLSLLLPALALASEWSYLVVASRDLVAVDNIVLAEDGVLYATLEQRGGRGAVVKIQHGRVASLLGGLDRPDGLLKLGDLLFITEESASGRILEYNLVSGRSRVVARLVRPEGIDRLSSGELVVAEDKIDGRVVAIGQAGELQVLATGLNRPEGLCVDSSGLIYVAVTADGNLVALNPDLSYRAQVVLSGLQQPDQVECHRDGSVWITEDAKPGRLLRYDPRSGKQETILEGLQAPQGMAFARDGSVYVAEQGKGRILRVFRRR